MAPVVRPLAVDDVRSLQPLDRRYSAQVGEEQMVDEGALSFFVRTGHAFVLEEGGEAHGFLLGQSVWDGRRPTVWVRRLVASRGQGREALLEAVTKSAYDAGVYDIVVERPLNDEAVADSLRLKEYRPRPVQLFSRVLGSRGPGKQGD